MGSKKTASPTKTNINYFIQNNTDLKTLNRNGSKQNRINFTKEGKRKTQGLNQEIKTKGTKNCSQESSKSWKEKRIKERLRIVCKRYQLYACLNSSLTKKVKIKI